jgi:hypothetical protein
VKKMKREEAAALRERAMAGAALRLHVLRVMMSG